MSQTLICVPTYNEAGNIERFVDAVLDVRPDVHLLVIDDDSPDGTGRIADAIADTRPEVHVLHRTAKEGLGRAYIDGFRWALERDYQHIVEMDADFSHRPCDLPELIDQLEHYDVVIGSRYVAGGDTENWGLLRRAVSRAGGFYARLLLGCDIRDLTAGFVAWRREVLETIDLDGVEASGYVFQVELKYRAHRAGFKILEVPIIFPDREVGESKMTPDIALEALTRLWKIRLK
jgi:dolichol-phosphate mannosyltransferase